MNTLAARSGAAVGPSSTNAAHLLVGPSQLDINDNGGQLGHPVREGDQPGATTQIGARARARQISRTVSNATKGRST